ncbi:hypothetical protein MUP77_24085 [Candidatus Bathyarchaeota archaeon]|nr:hypothetical protein [Candidatus Bathyarchaeota archaeon]
MSLSEGISAICEEILRGRNLRAQSIDQIKGETKKFKEEMKKTMATLHREETKMAKEGKEERGRGKRLLVKETNDMLKNIRKNRMEIRRDLLQAFGIWRNTFGSKGVSTPKISKEEKVELLPQKEVAPQKNRFTAEKGLSQAISSAGTLREKILTILKQREDGSTLGEISKTLDVPEGRLDNVIRRLVKSGDIRRMGGKYRMVSS